MTSDTLTNHVAGDGEMHQLVTVTAPVTYDKTSFKSKILNIGVDTLGVLLVCSSIFHLAMVIVSTFVV